MDEYSEAGGSERAYYAEPVFDTADLRGMARDRMRKAVSSHTLSLEEILKQMKTTDASATTPAADVPFERAAAARAAASRAKLTATNPGIEVFEVVSLARSAQRLRDGLRPGVRGRVA